MNLHDVLVMLLVLKVYVDCVWLDASGKVKDEKDLRRWFCVGKRSVTWEHFETHLCW